MSASTPALARISSLQPKNVRPNSRVGDRINNIQGLRAIAAMAVVFFHSGFVFPGLQPFGSFGVAIFFVISGYLMAMLCEKQPDAFLRRRFIRIVPPYWAFTLLLFAVALRYPLLLKTTRPDVVELLKSLLFIPFAKSSGIMEPVLFLGWTLNYEMFFYVVVGCCLLVSRRYAWLLSCAVLTAIVIACRLFGTGDVTWFYSRGLVFEFVAGIACYFLSSRMPWLSTIHVRLALVAAIVTSLFGMIYIQATSVQLPMPSSLAMGVLAFVMVLSATALSKTGWDIRIRAVVMLGDASYLLYLVHPYIEASLHRLAVHRSSWLAPEFAFGCLLSMAICAAVSVVLHVKVERPTIKQLNRLLLPARVSQNPQQPKSFLPACVPNPARLIGLS
jgi:exopolysaccharide production protein ExoZ